MKVLMMVWTYAPGPEGGAERQCRLLSSTLMQRSMDVQVLSSRLQWRKLSIPVEASAVARIGLLCPLEHFVRRLTHNVTSVCRVLPASLLFWASVPIIWMSRMTFLLGLLEVMRNERKVRTIDVIHVHESGWLAGVGVWFGRKTGVPVICKEATNPALQPISYGMPFRRYFQQKRIAAHGWVAQTENVQAQLAALEIPNERIFQIPNGVCIPDAPEEQKSCDTILYVGNLTQGAEWKAFDVLFDAWVQVVQKRPAAKLFFVGGGDASLWQNMLRARCVLASVDFVGRVSDPSPYYANASIFLLPSRVEGMSNALLEAQSWGLACIVSDIHGNTTVVRHDCNGLVVPVGDPVALSNAIVSLLDDSTQRQRLGQAARTKMVSDYSIQAISDRYLGLYHSLCQREEFS